MLKNRKDFYFKKAKEEGYRARSAYKLFELNKKYNLIKRSDRVLDLGCNPGSWLQAASKISNGLVVGVDILPVKEIKNVNFIQANVTDKKTIDMIKSISNEFDVILSDMAPKTSGIKELDHNKSIYLSEKALEIAENLLVNNGNFLCKVFQGEFFKEFLDNIKKKFEFVKSSKPESSRRESKEIYIIAKGFRK
ncbi:RlmE family RNA methyltransferase [Candidatus Woesearchaeota archaeon]|nr:RlmE family RNA methyltransferase [Candidatus Woesearchaeota archaeon]